MKKFVLSIMVILCSLLNSFVVFAAEAEPATMVVDGEVIPCDPAPITIDGVTYVPVRALFESLDFVVDFYTDEIKGDYIYAKDDNGVEVVIYLDPNVNQIIVSENSKILYSSSMNPKPITVEGSVMLPLRTVSEAMGYKIEWDNSTNTAYIESEYDEQTDVTDVTNENEDIEGTPESTTKEATENSEDTADDSTDENPDEKEETEPIIPMVFPVGTEENVISFYGDPRPNGRSHEGVDIGASEGTPIGASADGIVYEVGYNEGGWGYYCKVYHGDGVSTIYSHCTETTVEVGDVVSAGQTVGYVGTSGNAQGGSPHLHFEVRVYGVPVDPQPYLSY